MQTTQVAIILDVEYTGPPVILMWDFNGAKDYFEVLTYRAMDSIGLYAKI